MAIGYNSLGFKKIKSNSIVWIYQLTNFGRNPNPTLHGFKKVAVYIMTPPLENDSRDNFWDQIDLWPKKYVNQAEEWWKNWNVKGVSKKRKNKDYKKILEGNIPHYDVTTL